MVLALGGALGGGALAGNHAGNQPTTTTTTASGVKPSSTTKHDTTANAGSDKTKKYGNGQTAGQIAVKHGASTTTPLHGPGNSQPHKVSTCPKKGKSHEVDVHAKKKHASACPPSATPTATSVTHTTTSGTTESGKTTRGTTSTTATTWMTGGVRSAQGGKSTRNPASAGAVRAATATLARKHRGQTIATKSKVAAPAHAVPGSAHFTG